MKKVEYKDLYNFSFINGVKLSPDGQHAVYTEYKADAKTDGYLSYIWLLTVKGGKSIKLTNSGSDRFLRWLDNETVLFTSKRESAKGKTVILQINIHGGEAQVWKTVDKPGAGRFNTLAGGKYLVQVNEKAGPKVKEDPLYATEGRDLWVFDEIHFWSDGAGVTNKKRQHLYVLDQEGKLECIVPEYMMVKGISVSPDGKTVAYAGSEYVEKRTRNIGLYLYDVESGKTSCILEQSAGLDGHSVFFLDNEHLYYDASAYRFPGNNATTWIYDLKSGKHTQLPFADAQLGGGMTGDATYGGGQSVMAYEGKLYATRTNRINGQVFVMDQQGSWEQVTRKGGTVLCFDICGNTMLQVAMRGDKLAEVYTMNMETGAERQLTHFNDQWTAEHAVQTPKYFTWTNRDGMEMDGWIMYPVDYEKGKKYPAVYAMHGGPKVAYGDVFNHEMQCFTSQGYFVFFTNPRGADGRGEEFANITGRIGYVDYGDFMDFFDVILKKFRDIDKNKVAICGGSYAGYMCNWMVGHTHRFAAAASQRSISNYTTKPLTTDNGFDHNMSQMGTDPWTDFSTIWDHSPLKEAPQATTPTLFIQSDMDYRCWMGDAVQMFNALLANGTPTKMCLFHGESHGLSRIGKPSNRIGRLTEIGNWFEKYVK